MDYSTVDILKRKTMKAKKAPAVGALVEIHFCLLMFQSPKYFFIQYLLMNTLRS